MQKIPASELILNSDGSVYHLKLLPGDIADTVITVGDPDRVPAVSKYFDVIEIRKEKREFSTHTGYLNGKRLTVISTGMGTGNIDILMNELDALVNIDLETREIKTDRKSLNIVRLGTAGCIQKSVPLNALVVSSYGIGLDGLLNFYCQKNTEEEAALKKAFIQQVFADQPELTGLTYLTKSTSPLLEALKKLDNVYSGITVTLGGFYAPQGRALRLPPYFSDMGNQLHLFEWEGNQVMNLEMETAALYGLSNLLGHVCCSVSAIIAHRYVQMFSPQPEQVVDEMIQTVLGLLVVY